MNDQKSLGVPDAEPSVGPSAISPAKTQEDAAPVPHAPTHAPLPWHWWAPDHSAIVLSGEDEFENHVLTCTPCESCMKRGGLPEHRCTCPTDENMEFIARACNAHHELITIGQRLYESCRDTHRANKARRAWEALMSRVSDRSGILPRNEEDTAKSAAVGSATETPK